MKKFLSLILLSSLALAACDTVETPVVEENNSATDDSSVSEEAAYSFDLPEGWSMMSEGYDNAGAEADTTVWVGPESDFWTDGFYVRVKDAAVKEIGTLKNQSEVMLGSVSAKKAVYGWDSGYDVAYYTVEAGDDTLSIQVVDGNEKAEEVLQTLEIADQE